MFQSGFANIYGLPNVGKSTLLNAIVGQRLAIVAAKAQTTRKRVQAFYNTPTAQIVFSDTPGWIAAPKYLLHHKMIAEIMQAKEDGNVSILLVDGTMAVVDFPYLWECLRLPNPVIVVLNKMDKVSKEQQALWETVRVQYQDKAEFMSISALKKVGIEALIKRVLHYIPEGAPYYDTDLLCVQTERFLVEEFIREKIFMYCAQEIPYHTMVMVQSFQDKEHIIVITADILLQREGQRAILLGRGGRMIRALGIAARKDIEGLLRKKVFLDLSVKIRENWRSDERFLQKMGYAPQKI